MELLQLNIVPWAVRPIAVIHQLDRVEHGKLVARLWFRLIAAVACRLLWLFSQFQRVWMLRLGNFM